MKILLRLVCCAVGFAALGLTGALAQSPTTISIELVSTFDYPGATQTLPQKISDKSDTVGTFVDASAVTRGFVMLSNGNFKAPLVDPADTVGFTEGRGINSSRVVCGDYANDASGNLHGYFSSMDFTKTSMYSIRRLRRYWGSIMRGILPAPLCRPVGYRRLS